MENIMMVGATENADAITSLQIAEITGKQHAHVMRDIRSIIEQVNKSLNPDVDSVDKSEYHRGDRTQYNFLSKKTINCLMNWVTNNSASEYNVSESSYKDNSGKKNAMYVLNKKACYLLASGYDVVLRAKIIDRWEELESANKPAIPQTFAEALMLAAKQAQQIEAQQSIIEEQAPKALFADSVCASETSILIGDLAKLLNQNGIDIGQNRLFEWLRNNNYLCRKGEMRNMPTQRTMDMGLMEIKERSVINPDGSVRITRTPKVKGKGQIYFVNKFVKQQ